MTENLHARVRSVDFSILEEDAVYLLEVLEQVSAGYNVEVDEQKIAHIHRALLTQYNRGW